MKMHLRVLFVLPLLVVAACASNPNQDPSPLPTLPAPASASTLTPTNTPAIAPSVTATPTPAATSTPLPSATPTIVLTPSLVSMGTSNPSLVPETSRFFATGNTFSLVPPAAWKHAYFALLTGDTDGWVPPDADPLKINIGTILITIPIDIDKLKTDFESTLKEKSPDLAQIREDHLINDAGDEYLRWEVTYTAEGVQQHLIYAFYSSPTRSLVVIFLRPETEGSQYDLLADETFKTVQLAD